MSRAYELVRFDEVDKYGNRLSTSDGCYVDAEDAIDIIHELEEEIRLLQRKENQSSDS